MSTERKRIEKIENDLIPKKERELAKLQAAKAPNQAKIDRLKQDIQDLKDEAAVLKKQLEDRANEASDYLSGKTGSTGGGYSYTPIVDQPAGEAGVGEGSDYAAETDAKIDRLWTAGSIAAGVIFVVILLVVFLKRKAKKK